MITEITFYFIDVLLIKYNYFISEKKMFVNFVAFNTFAFLINLYIINNGIFF